MNNITKQKSLCQISIFLKKKTLRVKNITSFSHTAKTQFKVALYLMANNT